MNIYGARKTLRSHGWCWLNIGDAGAFVRSIGNRHRCRFCWRVFVGFLINLVLDVYGVYYISNMMNWKLRFMIMWCLKYWWNHSFLSSFFLLAFHARVGGLFFWGGEEEGENNFYNTVDIWYDVSSKLYGMSDCRPSGQGRPSFAR